MLFVITKMIRFNSLLPVFNIWKPQNILKLCVTTYSGCVMPCTYKPIGLSSHIHTRSEGLNRAVRARQRMIYQEEIKDTSEEDKKITNDVISRVNEQIEQNNYGRLFAVVQIAAKQFKVTTDDIIVIEGYWPPEIGDQLKLEKVLLVGGSDFTLIGRPVLSSELVSVKATVVEKTFSNVKIRFFMIKRKRHRNTCFHRSPYTLLRINEIEVLNKINEKKDFEGLEGKIF